MPNPVAMIRNVKHGDIEYDVLVFWCPGCEFERDGEMHGGLHMLPINTPNMQTQWTFEGTLEKPTLSPSVLTKVNRGGSPLVCHSFLREGVFDFLSDCTHQYANQKVPMKPLPDWVVKA